MLFLLLACGKEEDSGLYNCEEAPYVNYDNFGQAFLTHNCQGCHASTTANRYGAPDNVFFDTEQDSLNWSERILATTTGENRSMPPAGDIPDDEQVMLYWWLVCNTTEVE